MADVPKMTLGEALQYTPYFLAAVGCRDVGREEASVVLGLCATLTGQVLVDALTQAHAYHPDSIAMGESQARQCSRYGPQCNCWLPGVAREDHWCTRERRDRADGRKSPEYRAWRAFVLERDHASCVVCGAADDGLHAHHKKSFADHPELRYDVDNGETLCPKCYKAMHAAREVADGR